MIPRTIHQIWLNDEPPPERVQTSVASWQEHAPQFAHRLWRREELEAQFGAAGDGPRYVRSNFYRVKILGAHGGWYFDADTTAQPGVGPAMASITAPLAAATFANSHLYDNTPMAAEAGLPLWELLEREPLTLAQRWNDWLAGLDTFTTLPGRKWNAPKLQPGVLVVHHRGTLSPRPREPSTRFVLDTPAKKQAYTERRFLPQQTDDLQVVAMRKSGHHAIMVWLRALLGDHVRHYNNCTAPQPGMFVAVDRESEPAPGDWRMCNFEDFDLAEAGSLIGAHKLLVIRDPFNCFASRIAGRNRYSAAWLNTKLWKAHAREYLGDTTLLGDDVNVWRINFNAWHAREDYRRAWALEQIGRFNVDDRQRVPDPGLSMFDGQTFDGRAADMPVLDRVQEILDQEVGQENQPLHAILADQELHDLWARIEAL